MIQLMFGGEADVFAASMNPPSPPHSEWMTVTACFPRREGTRFPEEVGIPDRSIGSLLGLAVESLRDVPTEFRSASMSVRIQGINRTAYRLPWYVPLDGWSDSRYRGGFS